MSDFNNFQDNIKIYNLEPYVLLDGLTGATQYTGVSISFNDINKPIWKIKKEWQIENIQYMGFPEGNQGYDYAWSGRTGYTYQ